MERPFDYTGRHSDTVAPAPHHLTRAVGAGEITLTGGELGEYVTRITPWHAPDWWSADDIARVVASRFEAERCRHAHDCCGHYYAGRGRVLSITSHTDSHGQRVQLVLVCVEYSQNI